MTRTATGHHASVDEDRGELGEGTGKLGKWADEDEEHRASKQEGDPEALAVEGDPRGGLQSDDYRHADPRELIEEGDVAMSGPAGAPQEGLSIEERRARSETFRREHAGDDPDPGR